MCNCDLDPLHYPYFSSVLFIRKNFESHYACYFLSVSKSTESTVTFIAHVFFFDPFACFD